MMYQVRLRIKIAVFIFSIASILAGFGVWFYIFRCKEPTHGVFVYNNDHVIREELLCGYLYKPSKKDNRY